MYPILWLFCFSDNITLYVIYLSIKLCYNLVIPKRRHTYMQELIKITKNKNNENVVSAREIHEYLGIKTRFSQWVEQNFKMFNEDVDFASVVTTTLVNNGASRELDDYAITTDMAKHLGMLSKTKKGKKVREYFISVENRLKVPTTLKDALLLAYEQQVEIERLELANTQQTQIIAEYEPKVNYYDLVLNCPNLLTVTQIAKDYGMSAKGLNSLLNKFGVQYKKSDMLTKWTQAGRLFIYDLLKNNDILPLIER